MNKKLLAIACSWGALLLSSCMDTSVVESDMSEIPSQGITYYDGTIYEYLENRFWRMVIIVWESLMIPYSIYWIVPVKGVQFP